MPKHGFVLNDTRYHGQILLAGPRFGGGAARQEAAWALYDFGFRVIISSEFAGTFRANALGTGLLPLQVPAAVLPRLVARVTHYPNTQLVVDLPAQTLTVPVWEESVAFALDPREKARLAAGRPPEHLTGPVASATPYEEARTWSI